MVSLCCVCKKKYTPLNNRRTFHRFPRNVDLKLKWLNAIGRKDIYRTAVICSDHFNEKDFSENRLAKKKRLICNAVPSIKQRKKSHIANEEYENKTCILPSMSPVNVKEEPNDSFDEELNLKVYDSTVCNAVNNGIDYGKSSCKNITSNLTLNSSFIIKEELDDFTLPSNNPLIVKEELDESFFEDLNVCDNTVHNAVNNVNIYGKRLQENEIDNKIPKKQILLKETPTATNLLVCSDQPSNIEEANRTVCTQEFDLRVYHQMMCADESDEESSEKTRTTALVNLPDNGFRRFTRDDFTSGEAWCDFLRHLAFSRQKIRGLQLTISRRKKQIDNMNILLKTLQQNDNLDIP